MKKLTFICIIMSRIITVTTKCGTIAVLLKIPPPPVSRPLSLSSFFVCIFRPPPLPPRLTTGLSWALSRTVTPSFHRSIILFAPLQIWVFICPSICLLPLAWQVEMTRRDSEERRRKRGEPREREEERRGGEEERETGEILGGMTERRLRHREGDNKQKKKRLSKCCWWSRKLLGNRHKHTVVRVSNAVRDNKGLPVRIKVRPKFTVYSQCCFWDRPLQGTTALFVCSIAEKRESECSWHNCQNSDVQRQSVKHCEVFDCFAEKPVSGRSNPKKQPWVKSYSKGWLCGWAGVASGTSWMKIYKVQFWGFLSDF